MAAAAPYMSGTEVLERLEQISTYLDEFDLRPAEKITTELLSVKVDTELSKLLQKLARDIDEIDYDEAEKDVLELRKKIENR